jgi:hypothetical protein
MNQIKQLKEANHRLSIDNLRMRLQFEILIEGTDSKAAKKILAYYRSLRAKRDESSLSTQN